MRIKDAFRVDELEVARSLVRAHPFATIVAADLRATHMPCLVDEGADGLAVLGHVAWADPVSEALHGPLLLIFHGPHGYVSASWYGSDTIPTWNHVTLHVRGTPERFVETFHDEGQTDMFAAMRAYKEVGFDGPARPDHVPTLIGEDNTNPGYEVMGRLYAIGYIRGLMEGVDKTS